MDKVILCVVTKYGSDRAALLPLVMMLLGIRQASLYILCAIAIVIAMVAGGNLKSPASMDIDKQDGGVVFNILLQIKREGEGEKFRRNKACGTRCHDYVSTPLILS